MNSLRSIHQHQKALGLLASRGSLRSSGLRPCGACVARVRPAGGRLRRPPITWPAKPATQPSPFQSTRYRPATAPRASPADSLARQSRGPADTRDAARLLRGAVARRCSHAERQRGCEPPARGMRSAGRRPSIVIGWGGSWRCAVLADRKGEARSRSLQSLIRLYLSERSERGYPAQRPRAGRGLSIGRYYISASS